PRCRSAWWSHSAWPGSAWRPWSWRWSTRSPSRRSSSCTWPARARCGWSRSGGGTFGSAWEPGARSSGPSRGRTAADSPTSRPEPWGRLLVLAALLLAVRALRSGPGDRSLARREAIASGALFGLAAGTHLVPTVVGLAFLGAYAIGAAGFDRRPGQVIRV